MNEPYHHSLHAHYTSRLFDVVSLWATVPQFYLIFVCLLVSELRSERNKHDQVPDLSFPPPNAQKKLTDKEKHLHLTLILTY
jgi:hypothetical protein